MRGLSCRILRSDQHAFYFCFAHVQRSADMRAAWCRWRTNTGPDGLRYHSTLTRETPSQPDTVANATVQSGGYQVTFTTRAARSAGTRDAVTFELHGDERPPETFTVEPNDHTLFAGGRTTTLLYPLVPHLGAIRQVRVSCPGKGSWLRCKSGWGLESVAVHCLATDTLYTFQRPSAQGNVAGAAVTLAHPSVRSVAAFRRTPTLGYTNSPALPLMPGGG